MNENNNVGVFASQSAHESLSEEKAAKLGAGKFWNIIHLLNELDYLHIQEKQVRKPLDESFITKALWWYYLQRGVSGGVVCAILFFAIRAGHIGLSFVIPEHVNNALLYMISAGFVFKLSTYLLPMVTYHHGAATKAVALVLEGGIGAVVLAGIMKSYVVFMLIYYQRQILQQLVEWDYQAAVWAHWVYVNVLGPGYVEICFMVSILIGGIAAIANFKLMKKDLREDQMRGRPYNRLSVDQ